MANENVTGLMGALAIAQQAAKGTAVPATACFRCRSIGIAPDQMADQEGPTVGGTMFPGGSYKGVYVVRGPVAFNPRASTWGWLLKALAGTCASAQQVAPNEEVYIHTFKPDADDHGLMPWLTLVKNLGNGKAETYQDCRVTAAKLSFAAGAPLAAEFNLSGITSSYGDEVSPASLVRDETPLLLASEGAITVVSGLQIAGSTALKASSVEFLFGNALSEDDFVIGQYTVDDLTPLQRSAGVRIVTKAMDDDALYQNVVYNGGASWSTVIKNTNLVVSAQSAALIPGTGVTMKYQVEVSIGSVDLLAVPYVLQPGLVRLQLTGVLSHTAGDPYTITLRNATAGYEDPS